MGFFEEKSDMQEFLDTFKRDPTSVYLELSKDYREREYANWRHEVRKVAREATVSMKDMAMYLYIDKYHCDMAKELVKGEKAGEFTRRFLNEQGVDV
jgi:hypothetical protein